MKCNRHSHACLRAHSVRKGIASGPGVASFRTLSSSVGADRNSSNCCLSSNGAKAFQAAFVEKQLLSSVATGIAQGGALETSEWARSGLN